MKAFVFPLLVGVCLCFSSCSYLINTAIYGTNCETCRVMDVWEEVLWCDTECYSYDAKERLYERAEEALECYGGSYVSCFRGED